MKAEEVCEEYLLRWATVNVVHDARVQMMMINLTRFGGGMVATLPLVILK